MIQKGYGDYSYGSNVKMRRLIKQRGYGNLIVIRRNQHGRGIGSLFRTIFKIAKPLFTKGIRAGIKAVKPVVRKVAKSGLRAAKPLAKRGAKYVIKQGLETVTDAALDSIDGKNIKQAFKDRTQIAIKKAKKDAYNNALKMLNE